MIRYFQNGPKWLSINFGIAPEVPILSNYLENNEIDYILNSQVFYWT